MNWCTSFLSSHTIATSPQVRHEIEVVLWFEHLYQGGYWHEQSFVCCQLEPLLCLYTVWDGWCKKWLVIYLPGTTQASYQGKGLVEPAWTLISEPLLRTKKVVCTYIHSNLSTELLSKECLPLSADSKALLNNVEVVIKLLGTSCSTCTMDLCPCCHRLRWSIVHPSPNHSTQLHLHVWPLWNPMTQFTSWSHPTRISIWPWRTSQ